MKAGILLLYFCCYCFGSLAQLKKDDALLGIQANYTLEKHSAERPTGDYVKEEEKVFNGSAKFGYFFRDRFAMGGMAGYNKKTTVIKILSLEKGMEENTTETSRSNLFSVGPFIRGYKALAGKRIAFFLELDALYQFGKSSGLKKGTYLGNQYWGEHSDGKINGANVILQPGFVWFFRDRVGLEASLGALGYSYRTIKTYWRGKQTDRDPTNGFYANFGLNTLSLGLCFYLQERKS